MFLRMGGYIFFMRGRSVWLCRGTDAGEYGAVCVNVVQCGTA